MRDHDAADDPFASEPSRTLDHLEPVHIDETEEQMMRRLEKEAMIDAARTMIKFMHGVLGFIEKSETDRDYIIRLWAVSSALQSPSTFQRADAELANKLKTTRANFCKTKLQFEREIGLPPGLSQKTVEARTAYRKTRKDQLNGHSA